MISCLPGHILRMLVDMHSRSLGVGGGGGNYLLYDIVRMSSANSPLFQRCQVYDKPPFSKKKYMANPVFHHCYIKYRWSHFFIVLFENTYIFAQIFSSETLIVILICKLRLQTAKRVYKNQRTACEYVNILFNQVYE